MAFNKGGQLRARCGTTRAKCLSGSQRSNQCARFSTKYLTRHASCNVGSGQTACWFQNLGDSASVVSLSAGNGSTPKAL